MLIKLVHDNRYHNEIYISIFKIISAEPREGREKTLITYEYGANIERIQIDEKPSDFVKRFRVEAKEFKEFINRFELMELSNE